MTREEMIEKLVEVMGMNRRMLEKMDEEKLTELYIDLIHSRGMLP